MLTGNDVGGTDTTDEGKTMQNNFLLQSDYQWLSG